MYTIEWVVSITIIMSMIKTLEDVKMRYVQVIILRFCFFNRSIYLNTSNHVDAENWDTQDKQGHQQGLITCLFM